MNLGTVQRTTPRLVVLRGWDPNEPTTLTRSLRVKSGVTIKSGQCISALWNSSDAVYEWVLGKDSGADLCYIATKDSADFDVISADSLTALSCAGKFEVQTAFYKTGDTYIDGAFVGPDGTTGNFKVVEKNSADTILGVITSQHALQDIKSINSGVTPDVNGTVLVLQFSTHYQPLRLAS